jgi:Putative transposase, YhgA-like
MPAMPGQPTNIHDAFFRGIMSESEIAGTFLREHLPPQIVDLLTTDPPEPVSGSFVDEELAQHHSDLLLKMRLTTGDDALAYLLVEHKSAPNRLARLQLLRYVTRVLVRWHKEHRKVPLPPVVPILVHQGPGGWTYSTDFGELYGAVPDALRPYLMSFQHVLIDLAKIEDSALSAHSRPRSFFKAMKYIQRKDLPDRFDCLLLDAPALPKADLVAILVYIARGPVAVSKEIVQDALSRLEPQRAGEIMKGFGASFAAIGFERGVAEGEARGEARGEAKGEAKALTRLLEKRFGPLPSRLRERVVSAELAVIGTWFDRAIDAPDLQSVFKP